MARTCACVHLTVYTLQRKGERRSARAEDHTVLEYYGDFFVKKDIY